MNEIGSRQNRVRVYNNNKKRNKKNLFKYIFLSFFSAIIGFFQYLFCFNKKLEKEKINIFKKVELEIKNMDKRIKNVSNRNDLMNVKNNINEKEEVLNKIVNNKENIYLKTKANKNLDILYNYSIDLEDISDKLIDNKSTIDQILEDVKKEFQNTNPFIEEMKVINTKIEIVKQEFVNFEVKTRIGCTSQELKDRQEKIREKVDELKEKLNEIKNNQDINKIKNDFEILRLDNNKFLDGDIIDEFEMIYSHQERLLNEQITSEKKLEELKRLAREEERKKKQEEKKKKDEQRMMLFRERNKEDLFLIEDYIKKDVEKVNKEIKKLNKLLEKNRKKTSIPIFRTFINSTLRFGVTLLPLKLFKNKLLGNLLSMVLLNNKIRGMRNIVKKQELNYIDVESLVDNIKKNSDITNKNIIICDDSLYQLVNLKEEFINEYKDYLGIDEVSQTLNKIEVLENTLIKQKEKLTLTKTELNKAKVKVRKIG